MISIHILYIKLNIFFRTTKNFIITRVITLNMQRFIYFEMFNNRIQPIQTLHANTVGCCYKVVQYDIISYTTQQWFHKNVNQRFNSQKISHTLPSWASYRVSILRVLKNTEHIITALYYIHLSIQNMLFVPSAMSTDGHSLMFSNHCEMAG